MKWFDKSNQRYMQSISKEKDLEIGMARRVYYEKMTPEDAVVDIFLCNVDVVTIKESIDAWNRVIAKNLNGIILLEIIFWVLSSILKISK